MLPYYPWGSHKSDKVGNSEGSEYEARKWQLDPDTSANVSASR